MMNAHEFRRLSKVIIAYCGCNELPGLLCLGRFKHASGIRRYQGKNLNIREDSLVRLHNIRMMYK